MNTLDLPQNELVANPAQLNSTDPPPSDSCVQWMCDQRVLAVGWSEAGLEIVSYYARRGTHVPAWHRCMQDEQIEFSRRNYTEHKAGRRINCENLKTY